MDAREPINELVNSYYRFWFRLDYIYHWWAQKHQLSEKVLFVLYVIMRFEPDCTQNLIREKLFYSKQTVSVLLSKLEEDGFIYREPSPNDRRNNIVRFTEQGEQYAAGILGELRKLELDALADISEEERAMVSRTFSVFADSLHKFLLGGDVIE